MIEDKMLVVEESKEEIEYKVVEMDDKNEDVSEEVRIELELEEGVFEVVGEENDVLVEGKDK